MAAPTSSAAVRGNDSVTYRGAESSIDGGTGNNTLVMATVATVNLASADQTVGDLVTVTNFQNVDASALSTAISHRRHVRRQRHHRRIRRRFHRRRRRRRHVDRRQRRRYRSPITARKLRSTAAPAPTRLCCAQSPTSISAMPDVTTGDGVTVNNFQNVNAIVLSGAVTITGSSAANAITAGSGNDTIDGAGGADTIDGGGGNDTITYRGAESSIDGGGGTDTLTFSATGSTTAINLGVSAGADQTTGDAVNVANFENVNAGIFATALTVTGSSSANTITTGVGRRYDRWRRRRRRHQRRRRQRHRLYHGTETSVDGGGGTNTLILKTSAVRRTWPMRSSSPSASRSTIANFQNVDASARRRGRVDHRFVGGQRDHGGSGNDTIDGAGGADTIVAGGGNDTVSYYGAETSIDGGTGTNTLILRAAATVNLANADQTSGDSVDCHELPERRCVGAVGGLVDHRILFGQHDHRRFRQRHDRRRRRRRRHQCRRRQRYGHLSWHRNLDRWRRRFRHADPVGERDRHRGQFHGLRRRRPDHGRHDERHQFREPRCQRADDARSPSPALSSAITITTGSGNDTIDGGGGADVISAGGGNDTVSYYGN